MNTNPAPFADKMASPNTTADTTCSENRPAEPSTTGKRKRDAEAGREASKKPHVGPSASRIAESLRHQPHEAILAELEPKYEPLTLSVISSSKIEQRVTKMLLRSRRPVGPPRRDLLHARHHEVAKMIAMAEIVRRRIHESGPKVVPVQPSV